MTSKCVECGKEFVRKSNNGLVCSRKCRDTRRTKQTIEGQRRKRNGTASMIPKRDLWLRLGELEKENAGLRARNEELRSLLIDSMRSERK